jgi:hypothetical protein
MNTPLIRKTLNLTLVAILLASGLLVFTQPQVAKADTTTGLLAYYPFDGNANDSSGNGYNGIATNVTYGAGQVGQAAQFNNVSSFIDVNGAAGNLPGGNAPRSVAFWVYPTTNDNGNMVSWGANAPNQRFSALHQGDRNMATIGYFNDNNSGYLLPINTWTHVAVTYNSTNLRFYINGTLFTTVTPGSGAYNTDASQILRLGVNVAGVNNEWFGGSLDEVRIYNRALAPTDIAELYNAPNALDFDGVTTGTGDYVHIANPYTAFTNQITVEAWVYFDGGADGIWMGQSVENVDNMGTNVWLWHAAGTNDFAWLVNNGGSWRSVNLGSVANGWHHVATVADASGIRFFIDGAPGPSAATPSGSNIQTSPGAIMHIGKDPRFNSVSGRYASQRIDELRIWNLARTQAQIAANMNVELASQAGLVALYHFNQGVANGNNAGVTTAMDSSGAGRDGTLMNFALNGPTSNWVNGQVLTPADATAPTVTGFAATSPSSSLNIPITAFTATDNVAVTGYLITTSSTPPSAGAAGWTGTAPGTYTVGGPGTYTLYPWAKDAAGNVSAVYASPAAVTVCSSAISVTSNANSGAGTLRQAITDVCAGGTITFGSGLSGQTIRLASRLILDKNMTIDGSSLANSVTLSGDTNSSNTADAGDVQIFYVYNAVTPPVVTLKTLTLDRGLGDSTLWGLPVAGAIHNAGTLNVYNSTFTNHTAVNAGAIANTGTATIVNSTFSGNSATPQFGQGFGGAIYNTGALTLNNNTFSGNSVDATMEGAAIYNNNSLGLGATLNYANTIIANSSGNSSCYTSGTAGTTIGTNTKNLVEGTTNCAPTYTSNANLVTPLGSNGGSTQTFALQANSLAINTGDAATCANAVVNNLDQRGTSRPQGVTCDIGSYEYAFTVAIVDPGAAGGNGPGGVGYVGTTGSLQAWYRADRGVYTDGCGTAFAADGATNVACWKDQSGKSGNNATLGTGSPTYNTNMLNGQPVLTFNGSNSQLVLPRVVQDNFTIISLFRTSQAATACGTMQWYCGMGLVDAEVGGVTNDFGTSLFNGRAMTGTGAPDATITSALSWNNNAGHMFFSHRNGNQLNQFVDGANTGTTTGSGASLTASPRITIGSLQYNLGYFQGNIPEVILFSANLVDVDRILVQNYLSAKYAVALSANDVYDGDTTAKGDFDRDVAGIGRFGGNNHTQAFSAGMIVVNRTFLQDNGDWLTFGHLTPTNGYTNADVPTSGAWATAPKPMRWARHWYFNRTDAAGTTGGMVDIIFDFSEGNMNNAGKNPAGPLSNYRLLKRDNPTGQFTEIAIASAIVGDQVQFLGVNVNDLGSNFTLGTLDDNTSPTAIQLDSLTVSRAHSLALSPWLLFGAAALLLGLAGAFVLRRH